MCGPSLPTFILFWCACTQCVCIFNEYSNLIVSVLQCVFMFWLLNTIFTCLYDIALSPKFVSQGYNLFSEILLKVLLDAFGIVIDQGSIM